MIELAPLMRVEVTLEPIRDLGETPLGRRRIIGITGGTFKGARLSGKILPGGADWQVIRSDGVAYLDARYTLETSDGALIYVNNKGYRHGPKDVIERMAKGEDVDPALYYMRATPWFETSAPGYAWLNRIICVATGARRPASVELDFYEVR
jgi:5-methylphenazine-1-carboxylate 1-monooxygenase